MSEYPWKEYLTKLAKKIQMAGGTVDTFLNATPESARMKSGRIGDSVSIETMLDIWSEAEQERLSEMFS